MRHLLLRMFVNLKVMVNCTTFLAALLLCFPKPSVGQSYDLPKVIDPSPQSQAFTRYGDYPMASYTGLTDISVPLHTIKGRKLSLPITMGFHASGRLANEMNGVLGIRWTLNCGGLVTRTMKGLPDEWNGLTPFDAAPYVNSANGAPFDVLYSACPDGKLNNVTFNPNTYQLIPTYDSEFDIFDYALPNGKQGHFVLKNQNGTKVPMTFPYDPVLIEYVTDQPSFGYIGHVKITDDDGTRYIFGGTGTPTGNAVETTSECDILGGRLNYVPTAWYLTKIVSADGTDSITFSYVSQMVIAYGASESASIGDRMRDNSTLLNGGTGDAYEDDFLVPYYEQWHVEQLGVVVNTVNACETGMIVPMLSGVQFNGGSASMSYTADNLLAEIVVNRGTTPYKKMKFNIAKHTGESEVSYLDSLFFYGEDQNTAGEKYAFSYYEGSNIGNLQDAAVHKDWWGYYNSLVNRLLPYQSIAVTKVPSGNSQPVYQNIGSSNVARDGNENDKKMGMLRAVTYPTGGRTEFVYEGNKYGNNVEGPGIRIKEIVSTPVDGAALHRMYKYGATENGMGSLNEYLSPGSNLNSSLMATEGVNMYFWTADGLNPLVWPQAGFRIRNFFCDPYLSFGLSGSPVKYNSVTEYYVKDDVPQQKTQTTYSWGQDLDKVADFTVTDHDPPMSYTRKFVDPENVWQSPVMTSKTVFRYANGQFDTARNETYEYSSSIKGEAWDMPTYLHTNIVYARSVQNDPTNPYSEAMNYHNNHCSVYGYGFRKYTAGSQLLTHVSTKEYTGSGGTVKSDEYTTYDDYNQVRSKVSVNSKGQTRTVSYKYPTDYPGVPTYAQMVQRHLFSPVIETAETVNGVQTKKLLSNYYSPYANIFVPQSIVVQNGNSAQETRVAFNQYDNFGNVLEQQKSGDVKEVYLWGYGSRYPVARIVGQKSYTEIVAQAGINAVYLNGLTDDATIRNYLSALRSVGDVQATAYTYKPLVGMTSQTDPNGSTVLYEYDTFGRLVHTRDKDNMVAQRFYYNYAGQPKDYAGNTVYYNAEKTATLTRSNCVASVGGTIAYTVPARKYGSTVSQAAADQLAQDEINTVGQAQANQLGSCTYSSAAQQGVFTRNNCAGGGQVSYSVAAGAYTSTVSQADADQKAVYALNVEGQAYANANGTCSAFTNTVQSAYFNRNNCGTGYQGTGVLYTVAANTYTSTVSQADANQKALNALNANGQAYANANGSCFAVCSFSPATVDNVLITESSVSDNMDGTTTLNFTLDFNDRDQWEALHYDNVLIGSIVGNCRTQQNLILFVQDDRGLNWEVDVNGAGINVTLLDDVLPLSPYYCFPVHVTATFTR
ncbi:MULTISPECIES: DUF5977 domain-containing protein [Chitinophagaceae]